jgi:hypothetical protein
MFAVLGVSIVQLSTVQQSSIALYSATVGAQYGNYNHSDWSYTKRCGGNA